MPGLRITDEDRRKMDKKFICTVCHLLLLQPMLTCCGHLMCALCVQVLLESSNPRCPEDDAELKKEELFPDAFTKREIKRLALRCPNPGCSWFGRYDDLEGHSGACEYELIDCVHSQCGIKVVRCHLSEHLDSCEYRKVQCEYCKNDVTFATKTQHIETSCEYAPVFCRHCNERVLRKDVERHERVSCEDVPMTCTFDLIGCDKSVRRRNLNQHLNDGLLDHARLAIRYIPNSIFQIWNKVLQPSRQLTPQLTEIVQGLESSGCRDQRTELQDELKECVSLIIKIMEDLVHHCENSREEKTRLEQTLENAMSLISRFQSNGDQTPVQSIHSYNGILLWKIDGFQRKRQDAINGVKTALYSQPFYSAQFGYKMCAKIYMNGDGIGKGTHLSLFFVVMKGDYDDVLPWPFQKKVTLMLLDQGNGDHMIDAFQSDPESSSSQCPTSDMNIASGSPLFMPLGNLNNRQYIKDDVMFVKIIVE